MVLVEGEVRPLSGEDCCLFGPLILSWVLRESRIRGGRGSALCEQLQGPESSWV